MKKIFIIPYRARLSQMHVFINHMEKILEDEDYEFIFVHQCDKRPFNRGAMKNIGFLYIKKKYPHEWRNMTLIFHDIDCVPYKKGIFDYETEKGIVKHYFGFNHVLGGIFAIKGSDFEKTYGFPNLWGWGFEDNAMKKKWEGVGGKIDRSQWLSRFDTRVVGFSHGLRSLMEKVINPHNVDYYYKKIDNHGFHTLKNLQYTMKNINSRSEMLNTVSFTSETDHKDHVYTRGTPKSKYIPSRITRMSSLLQMRRR